MPILVGIIKSPKKDKRYRMIIANPHKIIDFGMKDSYTYVDGADDTVRQNYLSRHAPNEDWNELTPGAASRWILWGDDHDVEDNLLSFIVKFGLEVPPRAIIRL